jgi:hypothetical protein
LCAGLLLAKYTQNGGQHRMCMFSLEECKVIFWLKDLGVSVRITHHKEIRYEAVEYVHLVQDGVQQRAFLKKVLLVP